MFAGRFCFRFRDGSVGEFSLRKGCDGVHHLIVVENLFCKVNWISTTWKQMIFNAKLTKT